MDYDIIIVGAGPAGLSFARSLADTGLQIRLIEKSPGNILANPPYDGREIALTHLSHKILNDLGMWQLIPDAQKFKIRDAKVVNGNSPYSLNFDHRDAGRENLGFMVSNNAIRKAAYGALREHRNVAIRDNATVLKLGSDMNGGWVELGKGERLTANLIVAADSRFSTARRMMGIATSMLDFDRTCIVCTMAAQIPHNDTAIEYFHYDRTLAILPLNQNQVSVVVTLKPDDGKAVLGGDKHQFAVDIARRADQQFGDLTLTSELFAYPLVATFARTFWQNRFALIGDAAVGMHPVTAHGFNLGLQGADKLAHGIKSALTCGQDFAGSNILRRYSDSHRRACLPIYHGTNALVQLYTNDTAPARIARGALLHLGNAFTPARNLIIDRLTEIKGLDQRPLRQRNSS